MKLRERRKARDDTAGIFADYHEIDPELARKFSEAYQCAVEALLAHPFLGPCTPHAPSKERIRFWLLPRPFQRYLVFYKVRSGTLEIVRVLHGMRDLPPGLTK